jgi:hypothetical protein
MKFERVFFPLMVFAAVIAVYLFFRKAAPAATTSFVQPSAAGSGIPNTATEAPQNVYNIGAPQYTPSPLVLLSDPSSNQPAAPTTEGKRAGGGYLQRFWGTRTAPHNQPTLEKEQQTGQAPSYLSWNVSPILDLTKQPSDTTQLQKVAKGESCGSCGCNKGGSGGGCNQCGQIISTFPDGSGSCQMVTNRHRLISHAPTRYDQIMIDNLRGYAGYAPSY